MKGLFTYRVPKNILISINLLGLLLVAFYHNNINKISIITIFGLIVIIYISNFILSKISPGDEYIFLIVSMLMSLSIIMIYRLSPELGLKQIIWFVVGVISLFTSYFFIRSIKLWPKLIYFYISISLLLYLATLIFGKNIKGATNWIVIQNKYSFQPAELIKVLFVFFLASYYVNIDKFENKLLLSLVSFGNIGFLFLQKDLGSALIFFTIYIIIVYVYERDRKFIIYNIIVASILAVISYFLFNHVKVRVEIWINPWKYIDSGGYQVAQSLFAIAAGGFLGTGIGRGYPKYIPEVHNDFIFSAYCEEMGLLTGIAIIMLYMILIYRGIKITLEQKNKFYRIVALGITSLIGVQAFIILGGVTKMIPLTGVTLPFLSYGGSSLVASFASLGILQACSEVFEDEKEDRYGQEE